jgi:hypothetical protein
VRIERREYKYLIDAITAQRVRERIFPFCQLDPYAQRSSTHTYRIESLYFDTVDMALYRATVNEHVERFKLRVRHYPASPLGSVFLEVKSRYNDVISKTRGAVPRTVWKALLEDPAATPPAGLSASDRAAVAHFRSLCQTCDARPVSIVRYHREPWVSVVDDYARVTFDTAIESQPVESYSLDPDPARYRAIDHPIAARWPTSPVVLELKFTAQVPLWLHRMVRSLDLSRRSFSKYGNSVEAWDLTAAVWGRRMVVG